jgi:hypothetical protein
MFDLPNNIVLNALTQTQYVFELKISDYFPGPPARIQALMELAPFSD